MYRTRIIYDVIVFRVQKHTQIKINHNETLFIHLRTHHPGGQYKFNLGFVPPEKFSVFGRTQALSHLFENESYAIRTIPICLQAQRACSPPKLSNEESSNRSQYTSLRDDLCSVAIQLNGQNKNLLKGHFDASVRPFPTHHARCLWADTTFLLEVFLVIVGDVFEPQSANFLNDSFVYR